MATQALQPKQFYALTGAVAYGDWMTERVKEVLAGRFRHQNQDGSIFTPRIARAYTFWPFYHIVELFSNGLWHFRHAQMISVDTLSAMTVHVGRPVRTLTVLPPLVADAPPRSGLAYVISLIDLPAGEAAPLPGRIDLNLDEFSDGKLLVPLGIGASGAAHYGLPDINHAFVTGASGSGKSTLFQSTLASLLSKTGPDQLRLVLVDPKRLELGIWKDAPHLLRPVAHTVEEAMEAFKDLFDEVNRRGDLMEGVARNLDGYNRQVKAGERLPYILCMVDESLDLILQAEESKKGKELVTLMKLTASKARATGVILWFSATHGTADNMPRVIKANLASKFVFRVDDADAARVAGCPGAEKIPRGQPGRMLAKINGAPVEMQAYYLDDETLMQIAGQVAKSAPQQPVLSKAESELVRYAIEHLDGSFTIGKLADAGIGSWTKHRIDRLAQDWERLGLLTAPASVTEARQVTLELATLANVSGQSGSRVSVSDACQPCVS